MRQRTKLAALGPALRTGLRPQAVRGRAAGVHRHAEAVPSSTHEARVQPAFGQRGSGGRAAGGAAQRQRSDSRCTLAWLATRAMSQTHARGGRGLGARRRRRASLPRAGAAHGRGRRGGRVSQLREALAGPGAPRPWPQRIDDAPIRTLVNCIADAIEGRRKEAPTHRRQRSPRSTSSSRLSSEKASCSSQTSC